MRVRNWRQASSATLQRGNRLRILLDHRALSLIDACFARRISPYCPICVIQ